MKQVSVFDWQEGKLKNYTVLGNLPGSRESDIEDNDDDGYPPGYQAPPVSEEKKRKIAAFAWFMLCVPLAFFSGLFWLVCSIPPLVVPMFVYMLSQAVCVLSCLGIVASILVAIA